jgi:hypothetical protein
MVLLDAGECTYLGGLSGTGAPPVGAWGFPARLLVTTEGLYIYDARRSRKLYGQLLASIAFSEIVRVEVEELTPDHARAWNLAFGIIGSGQRVRQTTAVAFLLRNGDHVTFGAKLPVAQVKPTIAPILAALSQRSPSAPAAPAQPSDIVGELERLAALRDRGVLTDEEFASQKAKVLE